MTSRITPKTKGAKPVNRTAIKKSSSRRSSISNREENGSVIEEKMEKKLQNASSNAVAKNAKTVQPSLVRKSDKSRSKAPVTPTSSRVTKSQYFPSKNIYSDALLSNSKKDNVVQAKKSSTDPKSSSKSSEKISKTSSKTLLKSSKISKTSSVVAPKVSQDKPLKKVDKSVAKPLQTVADMRKLKSVPLKDVPVEIYSKSPDSSSISVLSDRPRTATLRKGSIVNANIVGPDAPRRLKQPRNPEELEKLEKSENEYEDDFESYESDFEVYSSSTKSSISQNSCSSSSCSSPEENLEEPPLERHQQRASSASTDEERKLDSGNFDLSDYKHKQILSNIKESIEKENSNIGGNGSEKNPNPASLSDEGFEEAKSLQYINFLDAKRKTERKKSIEIRRKRGEEILSMIRLDAFSFTIFDSPAIGYEEFIRVYGKSNCVQTGVQTGEDDVEEEVQTDEVFMETKWTQCPQVFSNLDLKNLSLDSNEELFWRRYKEEFLGVGKEFNSNFPNENFKDKSSLDKKGNLWNENGLKKYISLAGNLIINLLQEFSLESIESKFIKSKSQLPFSDGYYKIDTNSELFQNSSLVTISFHRDKNKFLSAHEKDQEFSFIALWEIYNLDAPKKTFLSHGQVTCLDFYDSLILAGLLNGTISVWTLDAKKNDLATASFTSTIASGHLSKIIGIAVLHDNENKFLDFKSSSKTKEIVSLDMDGVLISWIVHLDNAQTRILQNIKSDLKEVYPDLIDLECTNFIVDNNRFMNFLYIATNYGFVVHHLINNPSNRNDLKSFKNDSNLSAGTCLEKCPFSNKYFLSGYANGKINLYGNSSEKPLIGLHNQQEQSFTSLKLIQWSRNCPFVIYSLDQENTIHVWDLNESDIFPIYSVPFQERLISFKISPMQLENDNKSSYMVIGSESGLYLHLLNKQHGKQSREDNEQQKNTFFNYVNRL